MFDLILTIGMNETNSEIYRRKFKRSLRNEIIASRSFLSRPIIDIPTVEFIPIGNVTNFRITDRTVEIHAYRPVDSKWTTNCNKYLPFASHPSFNWFSRKNEKLEDVFIDNELVDLMIDNNVLEIIFHRISYSDTGFYFCRGVFGSTSYELKLVIIVYGLAELSLKSMISYFVESCDNDRSLDIAIDLANSLCNDTGTYTPLSCPYGIKLHCQTDFDYQDIPRDVMVVIVVRHTRPNADYSRMEDTEECTLSCRITRMKEVLTRSVEVTEKHFENLNYRHIGGIRYNKISNNDEHDFVCAPGFNFFTLYTCAACLPGTFMEEWNDLKECLPCPRATYQDEGGRYSCRECKNNLTTLHEGSVTDFACRRTDYKHKDIEMDLSFLHEGRIREEESIVHLHILLGVGCGIIITLLICGFLCHKWPWLCFPRLCEPLLKNFCRRNCRICYYHVWQGRDRSKKRRRKTTMEEVLKIIEQEEALKRIKNNIYK